MTANPTPDLHCLPIGICNLRKLQHSTFLASVDQSLLTSMVSIQDEKASEAGVEHLEAPVDVFRDVRGTAALEVCTRLEPVQKLSKRMIQLYAICSLAFLGSTMGGY